MDLELTNIRYFGPTDPHHYTVDNRPLQDLEANDTILRNAILEIQDNVTDIIKEGSWAGFEITFPVVKDKNKAFAYKFSIWAVQNRAILSPQTAALLELNVIGFNTLAGEVTISGLQLISNTQANGHLEVSLTPVMDGISFTFSGYSGVSGYVALKAQRIGS